MNTESLNSFICPLLTDMYQLTMAYAYWTEGRENNPAVFDLFFRKNPFKGEFCIFAGLQEVIRFVETFRFTPDHINFLKEIMPHCENEFFDWLASLDCSKIKVYAMEEGTIVFPREPLIRIEGPIGITQMLETTLLNLVNFPSLIATNAARMRLAAGKKKTLLEFGLRRAQGPDGAMTASKFSYVGGFDGTSNLLAGMVHHLPVKGTHAHSFVMSHQTLNDLKTTTIRTPTDGSRVEFFSLVMEKRRLLGYDNRTHEGELAAFLSYACAFPRGFLALIDTYDTLISGVPNFLSVGWALFEIGYKPLGVRLDSGDLAYLSIQTRKLFREADQTIGQEVFSNCTIVASNDLNEEVIIALERGSNEIDVFAVGTNLVTCQSQPALGCVFKLVEINDQPRIKLSQEVEKTVIPGKKNVYRLIGSTLPDSPVIDVIQLATAPPPLPGQRILCRHPFQENKRAYIVPTQVIELLKLYWDGEAGGRVCPLDNIEIVRNRVTQQLSTLRPDHLRPLNPTPYKVSVDAYLYDFMHNLWMSEAPINDLS